MVYTVTVTRQGQISLPAKLRRIYNFDGPKKIGLRPLNNGQLLLEPLGDILSLKGTLKSKKRYTKKQIRGAFASYLAKRHRRHQ